jgi:pimeloyl-ACP methyl ester carboxylesterase
VAEKLRKDGSTVHTPTIAGHGPDADRDVDLARCVQSVIDYIVEHDVKDIILLGHSFGGIIIPKVAEVLCDRIRRLVFWNAFVLADGECLSDNVPPHYRTNFANLAASTRDNSVMLPFEMWREAFMNDADLELATNIYQKLSPEPHQPFLDKVDMKKFYELKIPKSYLNCTTDNVFPQGNWHPRMSQRLGLFRLVEMSGGHEAMFTNPDLLALKILEAGRD